MRTSVRRGLSALAIAGGFTLLGFATAGAATADTPGPVAPGSTSGEDGILSGNQTSVDVIAPVEVGGNQLTVIGDRNSSAAGSGESRPAPGSGDGSSGGTTSGEDGAGSGNQTAVEVQAPVDVSDNQVTVIGDRNESAAGDGGPVRGAGPAVSGDGGSTSGEDGIGSGNQTAVDACVPVDASGNQVTILGDGNRSSAADASPSCDASRSGGTTTTGEDGAASGNQSAVGVHAPVDASGNQVTVIGDGNRSASEGEGSGGGSGSTGGGTTSGEDGVGSGNQTTVAPWVPVDVSGNQVTVIGDGNTRERDGNAGDGAGGDEPGDDDGPGDGAGTGDGDGTDDGDDAGGGGGTDDGAGGDGAPSDDTEFAGEQAASRGAGTDAAGAGTAGTPLAHEAAVGGLTATVPSAVAAGLVPAVTGAAGALPAYGPVAPGVLAVLLGAWWLTRRSRTD